MDIHLENIGKRFSTGWVFKDISFNIPTGQKFSITGMNGSGKSTLINIISGYLSNTKGKVSYSLDGQNIDRDDIYKHCAISFAYSELDEELTAIELFKHYKHFKNFSINDNEQFIAICDLKNEKNKPIKNFSSGMKQRLSLALAFTMKTPLLLLDEPTSFLDTEKKKWYKQMMENYTKERTVIIASNDPSDIAACEANFNMGF